MRLHLNENTAGCSPTVVEALRQLGRPEAGFYPDYDDARQAVAGHFGVPAEYVVLTNGLDEGILAACASAFRDRSGGVPETLGVVPAFDMYDVFTTALGGHMVTVPTGEGFTTPLEQLRKAVTERTRIAFLANPHNPSGVAVPLQALRNFAQAIAPAILFVDEAYADFSGETLIDRELFDADPSLLVGRTFSKAYGIAGLRVGAVLGHPSTLAPLRQVVPPYSLNAWATAAVPVAIADCAYRNWYVAQAAESRALLTAACERLKLQTWPSAANFVLVRVGPGIAQVIAGLAAKGIRVRDRSSEPGCEGCIRITAGIVDDTRRLIAALEEAVCGAVR
jgi:histidinol-phosphate aminotransferase